MAYIRDLFFILAGISLSIGLLSLLAGILLRSLNVYRIFGIFSIGAGLYYLIFTWIQLPGEPDPVIYRLSITFAAIYYISFPLFISYYSGDKRKLYSIVLGAIILLGYITFLFTDLSPGIKLWNIIVFAGALGIGIYGVWRGRIIIRNYPVSGYLFTAFMGIFLFLLLEEILFMYSGFSILTKSTDILLPMDLFPMMFIIIMSGVFIGDLVMKYRLQKELNVKELKWSTLIGNVQLIVTELDLEGNIQYVNHHFRTMTGYEDEEICGKNWYTTLIHPSERVKMLGIFNEVVNQNSWPEYQNRILTKKGKPILINWSNLPIRNESGTIEGVLSIGFDLTQQEKQLREIEELKKQLEKENLMLHEEISRRSGGLNIIGESSSIKYTINKALQVAPLDSTVLLEGETGVGKELFADLIQSRSSRQHMPYLKINCAAIPKELIESELFGHKKGSFTGAISDKKGLFAMADKGTLFLDEISAMPYELQSKLLRVLQSGEFHPIGSENGKKVNVRIIAATNENLKKMSEENGFRKDLYYRLNVYPVTIPPLRQRKEDIPLLISHFSKIIGERLSRPVGSISKADMEKLESYDWPGNVRELENWIERAIITSRNGTLEFSTGNIHDGIKEPSLSLAGNEHSMDDLQAEIILKTLEECNWKINGENGAANRLKLPPSTLRSKMKKLGIERPV